MEVDLQPGSDTGIHDDDDLTNVPTGTIDVLAAQAGDTVRIYRDGTLLGQAAPVSGTEYQYTFGPGDVLQLDGRVFGVLGEYRGDDGQTTRRLLIDYPKADDALAALNHLLANLDSHLTLAGLGQDSFVFRDYRDLYGEVVAKDRRLTITLDLAEAPRGAPPYP